MLPLWPVYFSECRAVVFVVDASDAASLAQAAVELFAALVHEDLIGKPVCLVVNKCDAPKTLSRWEVDLCLRLPDLAAANGGRLCIIYTSALKGDAVGDVLEWMVAEAAEGGRRGGVGSGEGGR
ncbi:hypothetical protein MNEG_12632 [Monoraphidium neglectum]|uniref:ADP-ribosylation factor-like protein 16 n=1 Tax=Monoraphidium neglectum TaxID=145388 RepID=A0A0D2LUL8_9CHLO|nr:hypothetical protein MNEG_12632 [Monoraphidium neglectum]KIY95329.1 hypothetical protein MNEG_12632 [Monoraphidium neglectum]|eukprot:XP_013894349.1 hypothetical protein MNEG_12632 [Monoraphidium neglectum]